MPVVSVLTPLYKTRPNHLREMIESVLAQTFKDFEFLLLNDSPGDSYIRKIVESYNDSRIRYIENENNLGISASRNILIKESKGKYLAILDHDDVCLPNRFEEEVEYLDHNPDVGVVSSWADLTNGRKYFRHPEDNLDIKAHLLLGCFVLHPAAMLRKAVLIDNNIFYEADYSPAEDYMLFVRLMGVTMFHNIPKVLLYYRDHEENTSHRQMEKMSDRDAKIKSIAWSCYPYHRAINEQQWVRWVYIFGVPLIQIQFKNNKKKYMLFGMIPVVKIK